MRFKFPRKWWLFLTIMGPGLITAAADNDAGGIATYSLAGARYGYHLLWLLFILTFSLAVVQEMGARMGAVTGKGLSDLIREQFGLNWTLVAMAALLVANLATTIAEFAGIAAAFEFLGISRHIAVPLMAFIIWGLVCRGSYKAIERVFLGIGMTLLTYVVAGILSHPDWGVALKSLAVPHLPRDSQYLLLAIGVIGTTITPWMQFFLQSMVVDKGITAREYRFTRWDVIIGAFFTDLIAFFIIIATAATLHKYSIRVEGVMDLSLALAPIAGIFSGVLFAVGLLGASLLSASILPLSTSFAICEAFGLERGLNRRWEEAPVFYTLYTVLIFGGALAVMWPKLPLLFVMLVAQQINGFLLPVILVFMIILVNNRRLMGRHVNSRGWNLIAGATVLLVVVFSVMLIFATLKS